MTGCGWANPFDDNIPYKTRFEDGLVFFEDEKSKRNDSVRYTIFPHGDRNGFQGDLLF